MPPITPGDINSVVNQVNQNIAQQNTNQITQIFKDDTGTRRVLLGKGKDGFYGLKVSKPTFDVYDAADGDLIFNSGQNLFKIVSRGTSTIAAFSHTNGNYDGAALTIPHGQSTAPLVQVYLPGYWLSLSGGIYASTYVPVPFFIQGENPWGCYYFPISGASYGALGATVAVDDTNITIQVTAPTSLATTTFSAIPVTYFILQETAS